MKEVLCARWGRCKSTIKCPLKNTMEGFKVYVLGECAGTKEGIVEIR